MSAGEFALPDLGEGLTEAEVVRWLVAVGDHVAMDQPVVEVETAKATVELPSPHEGVVTALQATEGQMVEVGAVLLVIGDAAADRHVVEEHARSGNVLVGYGTTTTTKRRRPARRGGPPPATAHRQSIPTSEAAQQQVSSTAPPQSAARPRVISPVVRRFAREQGVDLTAITGSAPGGVITRADVIDAIAAAQPKDARDAIAAPQPKDTTAFPRAVRERIPLRGAGRAAAEVFTRSRREIPEATTWVDVDATELVRLRQEVDVGLLALVARFVTAGLAQQPLLNSRLTPAADEIVVFDGVNLGVAVQTDRGLVVPVLKDAHKLSATGIHHGLARLTAAAREGTLAPSDLTGGTFTLNNYGVFGVDGAASIINHPEVAILGMGRIIDRPWIVDGDVVPRKITQLSLAFDHRVCDGGTAAAFLRFVADCMEDPQRSITLI